MNSPDRRPVWAAGEESPHGVRKMMKIDKNLGNTVSRQQQEPVFQQRAPGDGQEALGNRVGQRFQAGAPPRGKQDCLHLSPPTSLRASRTTPSSFMRLATFDSVPFLGCSRVR